MLQLFFKTSVIRHQEWEKAYRGIHSIIRLAFIARFEYFAP